MPRSSNFQRPAFKRIIVQQPAQRFDDRQRNPCLLRQGGVGTFAELGLEHLFIAHALAGNLPRQQGQDGDADGVRIVQQAPRTAAGGHAQAGFDRFKNKWLRDRRCRGHAFAQREAALFGTAAENIRRPDRTMGNVLIPEVAQDLIDGMHELIHDRLFAHRLE